MSLAVSTRPAAPRRRFRLWSLRLETDELLILTPWALLWASHGATRWAECALWWGLQIEWKRDPAAEPYGRPFLKEWRWDFRLLAHEVVAQGFESKEAYLYWAQRHYEYPSRWVQDQLKERDR